MSKKGRSAIAQIPTPFQLGTELYSKLLEMPEQAHGAFILAMMSDKTSIVGKLVEALIHISIQRADMVKQLQKELSESLKDNNESLKDHNATLEQFIDRTEKSTRTIEGLWKLLQKHRKPRKNEERDAEIIKLHKEGKTSGQIANLLKDRWQFTAGAARIVINNSESES